jgi:hypothetical protein
MLDQRLGGDSTVSVVRSLIPDDKRFVHVALAMLNAGEIRLLDDDCANIAKWKWSQVLTSPTGTGRIQITDRGSKRIA